MALVAMPEQQVCLQMHITAPAAAASFRHLADQGPEGGLPRARGCADRFKSEKGKGDAERRCAGQEVDLQGSSKGIDEEDSGRDSAEAHREGCEDDEDLQGSPQSNAQKGTGKGLDERTMYGSGGRVSSCTGTSSETGCEGASRGFARPLMPQGDLVFPVAGNV